MTIGDVLSTLNDNREVIGILLSAVLAAIVGKKKVEKAKARLEDLLAKAYAILDPLVDKVLAADAVTEEVMERLVGDWRTAFEAATRALNLDVTPEQMGKVVFAVRERVITAVAAYTKHRLPSQADLDAAAKRWDHLLNEVAPKHHAKLKAASERTRKAREARAAKAGG